MLLFHFLGSLVYIPITECTMKDVYGVHLPIKENEQKGLYTIPIGI